VSVFPASARVDLVRRVLFESALIYSHTLVPFFDRTGTENQGKISAMLYPVHSLPSSATLASGPTGFLSAILWTRLTNIQKHQLLESVDENDDNK